MNMPFGSLPHLAAFGNPEAASGGGELSSAANSWAVGRHAARYIVHRKGRFRSDAKDKFRGQIVKLPGYQRIGKKAMRSKGADASARGQTIIDGVRRSDVGFIARASSHYL